MPHVRSSRFPRAIGSGRRRKVTWSTGPRGRVTDTSAAVTVFGTGLQALEDDLTVVRIRGSLVLALETATAVNDGFDRVAVGIANFTENAFGAGVASLPDPIADAAWDGWMWYWTGSVFAAAPSASFPGLGPVGAYRIEIDNKAMRKTHRTDVLGAVISVADLNGTATLQTVLNTRVLDKLP